MLKLGRPRWVPILAALMVVGFAAGRSNAQTGAVNSIPDGPGGKATSSEVANPKQPTVQTSGTSSPAPQADDTQAPGKAAPGPPPVYYVEPVDRPGQDEPSMSPSMPPPPRKDQNQPGRPYPGDGPLVYEPPPPPVPNHVAPRTSLWLGARLGWWVPFGDLWGRCTAYDAYGCVAVSGVAFRDYVSSGPMLEMDGGARLGRHYNLYALWERARLGAADGSVAGIEGTSHGDTDFWAIGLRLSTDPDHTGLLVDIAVGARRLRVRWPDGTELQLTDAPLESRLGIGADVRISPLFSISPLLTLGVGSFGKAEWVQPDGTRVRAMPTGSDRLTHGWATLQVGGHFDLFGSR